jgi:hypothetical protein
METSGQLHHAIRADRGAGHTIGTTRAGQIKTGEERLEWKLEREWLGKQNDFRIQGKGTLGNSGHLSTGYDQPGETLILEPINTNLRPSTRPPARVFPPFLELRLALNPETLHAEFTALISTTVFLRG